MINDAVVQAFSCKAISDSFFTLCNNGILFGIQWTQNMTAITYDYMYGNAEVLLVNSSSCVQEFLGSYCVHFDMYL